MTTDAQFQQGDVVEYRDGDGNERLAVIKQVTNQNPAQYRVKLTDTNEETTCGEGVGIPGAVHAL